MLNFFFAATSSPANVLPGGIFYGVALGGARLGMAQHRRRGRRRRRRGRRRMRRPSAVQHRQRRTAHNSMGTAARGRGTAACGCRGSGTRRRGNRRWVAAGRGMGAAGSGREEGEGRGRWGLGFEWDLRIIICLHESQTLKNSKKKTFGKYKDT